MLWLLVSISIVYTLYVSIVVSELIVKLRVFGGFVIGLRLAYIIAKLASLSFKTPRAKSTLAANLGLLSYTVGI